MPSPLRETVAGRRPTAIARYLSAGVLLHAITAVELVAVLAVSGTDPHSLKGPGIALLCLCALFTQLDARSRFQEYKRVRDQLIRYGPHRRIFLSIAASRCQRDAGLAAARQLGHATACRDLFLSTGYRWYHLLPDFVGSHPGYLLSPAFLRATFFMPTYTSRYPHAMPPGPPPADHGSCKGNRT